MKKQKISIVLLAIAFLMTLIITVTAVIAITSTNRAYVYMYEDSVMSAHYLNRLTVEVGTINNRFSSILLSSDAEEINLHIDRINNSTNIAREALDLLRTTQINSYQDIQADIMKMHDNLVQYSDLIMQSSTQLLENGVESVQAVSPTINSLYTKLNDQQNRVIEMCLSNADVQLNIRAHNSIQVVVIIIILFIMNFIFTISAIILFAISLKHKSRE